MRHVNREAFQLTCYISSKAETKGYCCWGCWGMQSNNCHLSTSLPAARLPPSRVYLSPITAVICISARATRSQGWWHSTSHGDTQQSEVTLHACWCPAMSLGSRTHLTPSCAPRGTQGNTRDGKHIPSPAESLQEATGVFQEVRHERHTGYPWYLFCFWFIFHQSRLHFLLQIHLHSKAAKQAELVCFCMIIL